MREAIAWAHREVGTERLVRFKANDKSSAAIISYEDGPTAMIKATNSADPNYQAVTEEFEAIGHRLRTFRMDVAQYYPFCT